MVERHRDIVTLFLSEPDFGEAHALNKAIFRARGRYIKPITDDDYLYPDAMARVIEVLAEHPELDAIQCGGEVWDMRSSSPAYDGLRFLPREIAASPEALFSNVLCGLGLILRRSAMERVGGVSSNYRAVDADLMCRLVECGCTLRYLDIKLFKWHIYPHSGVNEAAKYSHDFALISLRMGDWQSFLRHDPAVLLTLAKNRTGARDRALAYWIWLAALIGRSPLWRTSIPIFWVVSQLQRLRRSISVKAPYAVVAANTTHEWTGRLR